MARRGDPPSLKLWRDKGRKGRQECRRFQWDFLAHGGAEFAAEGTGDDDLFAAGGGDGLGGFVGEFLGFEGNREGSAGRDFGGGETLGADLAEAAGAGFEDEEGALAFFGLFVNHGYSEGFRRDGGREFGGGAGLELKAVLPRRGVGSHSPRSAVRGNMTTGLWDRIAMRTGLRPLCCGLILLGCECRLRPKPAGEAAKLPLRLFEFL
jgi:hypothetical protein